jgi:NTE family protein
MDKERNKTGIVLSGGGVRGLSQIGVLAALEDNGIRIDCVSGSSIGAIIGAFYASGFKPGEMLEISKESKIYKLFKPSFSKKGISNMRYLERLLRKHLTVDTFEQLKKPLFVCACNLYNGKAEIFSAGPLIEPVLASAAIPVIFQPQEINGQLYTDGGLLNVLPAEPLRDRCDKVIGVFVHNFNEIDELKTWSEMFDRYLSLRLYDNAKPRMKMCDYMIIPEKAFQYNILKKKTDEELFRIGYEKTVSLMPDIKNVLNLDQKE